MKSYRENNYSKIGFLDSGIGGLNVLEACLPKWNSKSFSLKKKGINKLIYFADTGNLPYGDKSLEKLKLILRENLQWFLGKIDLLLLACNTSSVLLDKKMREEFPELQIITLTESLIHHIQSHFSNLQNLCIFSTQATHNSGLYAESVKLVLGNKVNCNSIPCPKLVPLIEESLSLGLNIVELQAKAEAIVFEYCQQVPLNCEAIILGCSHYPILKEVFQQMLPNKLLLDPSESLALKVQNYQLRQNTSWDIFASNDSVSFSKKLNTLKGVFHCVEYFRDKVKDS